MAIVTDGLVFSLSHNNVDGASNPGIAQAFWKDLVAGIVGCTNYTFTTNLIPTMTSATSPSGVASSDSAQSGYEAWKAMDGNDSSTVWATVSAQTGWLQYQFASATIINGYSMTKTEAGWDNPPKSWTFKGSNNGSTWVTLDTQTNITGWSAGVFKSFSFFNGTAYTYYRIDVSAAQAAAQLCIATLKMFAPGEGTWNNDGRVFNGSSTTISFGDLAALDLGSGARSFCCWIKPSVLDTQQVMFAKEVESTAYTGWSCRITQLNKLYAEIVQNDASAQWRGVTGSTALVTNTMYHCVFIYAGSSGNWSLYLNGVLETPTHSGTAGAWNSDNAIEAYIGSWKNNNIGYYTGSIASIQVYNKALSEAEVLQNYQVGPEPYASWAPRTVMVVAI